MRWDRERALRQLKSRFKVFEKIATPEANLDAFSDLSIGFLAHFRRCWCARIRIWDIYGAALRGFSGDTQRRRWTPEEGG